MFFSQAAVSSLAGVDNKENLTILENDRLASTYSGSKTNV
jgi:hypothetical protein